MSAQHLMYPRLRLRSILPCGPRAWPTGLLLAFCVQDACPDIVETPLDGLQTNGPLPTISPAATGSNASARNSVGLLKLWVPEMSPPYTGAQTIPGVVRTPQM